MSRPNSRNTFPIGIDPKPDRTRTYALGAVLVGAVLLGAFLFFQVCGGSGCSEEYCPSDQDASPPDGFQLVTDLYEFNAEASTPAEGSEVSVSVPLDDGVDPRGLTFYSFDPGDQSWEPLAAATSEGEGRVNGTFVSVPAYFGVLQRETPAGQVIAYLGAGATLHPEALGNVTMVHTADFTPAADGAVSGELTPITRDISFLFVPSITASGAPEGGLANVTSLIATSDTRTQHVRAIVDRVSSAGLDGIDVAYYDLPADQRTSFTLFTTELAQALHSEGKLLTLTLVPPARAADGSWDEGAYDWGELGEQADLIQVRPYRDQSTYRIVVPELIEYLATRVDASRLILTVSPFATEKGAGSGLESIRLMTIVEAMTIASTLTLRANGSEVQTESIYEVAATNIDKEEGRSGIAWSPETATVSFTYENEGGRTVFLENVFSIGFKLDYANRFELGGVAVEDASNNIYLGNIWPALVEFAITGQPQLLQPNSSDLAPRWFATGGTLDGGQRGVVTWTTPPAAGQHAVRITLSDGVALFENELPVSVIQRPPTAAQLSGRP